MSLGDNDAGGNCRWGEMSLGEMSWGEMSLGGFDVYSKKEQKVNKVLRNLMQEGESYTGVFPPRRCSLSPYSILSSANKADIQ